MKTARYCLEFVNLGGLLRQGEYLGKANSKMIANNILAKVFGRKPFSHEKCNILNLSLQINYSKNMPPSIKKQKSLNQAQV
ncbi:hypothetical protein [Helicobacter pylori]|uniref:Uncharacterized protein n=1 Tax=Helicobacter pylori Hp H-24 TaxID=992039 RepID=J0KJB5_HELPX|nr:hypothetical protein [Helicobacter pylori]EJB50762.1 hypothetical protein HPHPH24_1365 [Helicobacter pylori Hp H-24]EJC15835.1 hypothetical protein HPHPH24B_1733 [Helicobacter pylori Hp H-24b]EJC17085.1 hypothetical protein HPHPH24C_1553 [Helicobacter pylori Hp H-24c]EJC37790.1 hypothetical protein HPHPM1_1358 [Helicobacter pylori Hp M1]EJC40173.1 hypothetical protein HPHPM2_1690 [Helicobacter pylori Hp M2]